jgi:acyl-CoA reductase-like NAD-dependent aldehyde dehydrogenase
LLDACRFIEREAARLLAPRRLGRRGRPAWLTGVDLTLHREPHGVVLIIGPSNYPLLLVAVQTLQALVAGNSVVLKPGAGGTPAARKLRGVLLEAGLEPDLLVLLPESPESAHRAIDVGVDKVVLTGSADTGRDVLARLAPRLVPATMELSGCDSVFVRRDADLDVVVKAICFGLALNGGATCIAPRRIFVRRETASALEERLTLALAEMTPVSVAPARVARLEALLDDAVQQGGCLRTGREIRPEAFRPILVSGASPEMRLVRSDIAAPVVSLIRVADDEEALAAYGKCSYALGASVFGSTAESQKLAERIRAGVVVVNDLIVPTADPRLPFGGRGASGFGVTRGAEGLLEMTTTKAISVRQRGPWRHFEKEQPGDAQLFLSYVSLAHGSCGLRRWRAFARLVQALLTRRKERQQTPEEVSK